jgi:titin
LSTYLVTTTNDAGASSLRQAIIDSNGNGGPNVIDFDIGSGVQTINLLSSLPPITTPVTIDGTTEPDYAGTPLIELNGANAGSADGLQITVGNCTVKGLAINRFGGIFGGIFLNGSGGNTIVGNFIGTDATGTLPLANTGNGILVLNSTNNTIGGVAAGAGNLISGNAQDGVQITGTTSSGNVVQGNRIGTDVSGTRALGNRSFGVDIHNGSNNLIGGPMTAAGNLISGGASSGVAFQLAASSNRVQGNLIGTDVTGTQVLGNQGDGINVSGTGTNNNIIGGTGTGAGNVIAGNSAAGVAITNGSSGNLVQGNLIGTDVTGTQPLGNAQQGVALVGAGTSNNLVGGTDTAARNIISASLHNNGLGIFGGATANAVQGNYIGTDISGTVALANADSGVGVSDAGTSNNTIGGSVAGAGNLISGNLVAGIQFFAASGGNLVQGNYVGTDASGTQPLGNTYAGVAISGAHDNTVGGPAAGAANLISGNIGNGVRVETSGTTGNLIQGNLVGTDVTGTIALGNGSDGVDSAVLIDAGASNNTIGGTAAGTGNVVSGNYFNGVRIRDSSNNVIQGNFIGTDVTGTQPLGNAASGAAISGNASGNVIGGPGGGNTIAFNGTDGVLVDTAVGVIISQNSIFASRNLGIELVNGANNNQAFPVLTSATSDGSSTTIAGTLTSAPNTTFTLEFFTNSVPNPSGFGEGQQYLGSWSVTTDGGGNVNFTATFPTGDTTGQYIAATATDPGNDTSSFSQDVIANAAGSPNTRGRQPRRDLGRQIASAPGLDLHCELQAGGQQAIIRPSAVEDGKAIVAVRDPIGVRLNEAEADSNLATASGSAGAFGEPMSSSLDPLALDQLFESPPSVDSGRLW